MAKITSLFWDVGGILLTNGWDTPSRKKAAEKFGLDGEEFEKQHDQEMASLETGRLGLDEYMERTVFHQPRSFSREEFKDFIFAQSQPFPEALGVLRCLAESKRYLLSTLNNEALELNVYRIAKFGLREYFSAFFSSCFLGCRKPDETIYRVALQITQRPPEECVFIDDRPVNLEPAERCGMRTIHYQSADQLEMELEVLGIAV